MIGGRHLYIHFAPMAVVFQDRADSRASDAQGEEADQDRYWPKVGHQSQKKYDDQNESSVHDIFGNRHLVPPWQHRITKLCAHMNESKGTIDGPDSPNEWCHCRVNQRHHHFGTER